MKKLLNREIHMRWALVMYDLIIYICAAVLMLVIYVGNEKLSIEDIAAHALIACICIFLCRTVGNIYGQVWRYGGIQCYIRLLLTDMAAFFIYLIITALLSVQKISFAHELSLISINCLAALAIRMMYRYAYKCGGNDSLTGRILVKLLYFFTGLRAADDSEDKKIKIAIIGAGRVGTGFAEELLNNKKSQYIPICFIDNNKSKIGRDIYGIPVWPANDSTLKRLEQFEVNEIVLTVSKMSTEKKKEIYEYYRNAGYRVRVYDYPTVYTPDSRRHLRDFDIEELLFRKPIVLIDKQTNEYYRNKTVLITGGGGSIGSELCRQLAKMEPRQLIILDIYENCAYDVQQELKAAYGDKLNLQVEICSITNRRAMERVFETYHPQIVINAAAHKHVPLMEHNCIEAIENNVFGTATVVEMCERYEVERFMLVSTDKAVNPTNIMGATKRLCEMLVQSASTYGRVKYSATRFGNVLGSAGSVIPLFKKQIARGGPVTITDKRIIRYFMTIPEASQLVLQSGAIADNGELMVLDMGKPVRIMELAENMIRLSGAQGIDIVETGLRPGEKLYEELLVETEKLDKTDNEMIFIERDTPYSREELQAKLDKLKEICEIGNDDEARAVMKIVVPTYRSSEEVNAESEKLNTALAGAR